MKRLSLFSIFGAIFFLILPSFTASTAMVQEKCSSQKAGMDAAIIKVAAAAAEKVAAETALNAARMAKDVAVNVWKNKSDAFDASFSEWLHALEEVGNCQMNALNSSQCDGQWASAQQAEKKKNAAKAAENAAYSEMVNANNKVTALENKLDALAKKLQFARLAAGNAKRAYDACMQSKPKNA